MVALLLFACVSPPPPTVSDTADSGTTLPTATVDPPGWPVVLDTIPLSAGVTGVAVTDSGAVCVGRESWYVGYGSTAVDQYVPGEALVTRVTPGGDLDLAFGDAGTAAVPDSWGSAGVSAWGEDCDLVVGSRFDSYVYEIDQHRVARISASGTVDPTVGALLDHGPYDRVHDQLRDASGRLVVLGTAAETVWVARFTVDGALDVSFGTAGEVEVPIALDCSTQSPCGWGSLGVEPDGDLIVATGGSVQVVRLDDNGVIDLGYGDGGVARVALSRPHGASAPDGTFVLVGATNEGLTGALVVARLDGEGDLVGSIATLDPGGGNVEVHDVVVDGAGRVVVAGVWQDQPAIGRLGVDLAWDGGWQADGMYLFAPPSGSSSGFDAIALAPDGAVIGAGHHGDLDRMLVVRLDP